MNKVLLLVLGFILSYSVGHATHIVGGEVNYVYNGGTSYTVIKKIYRDDFNGNPAAQFDDPAVLVIFDDAGIYVNEYYLANPVIDQSVDPPFSNPCLDEPTNVIIQEAVYTAKINLIDPLLGYHLVYARCCRNGNLINNLQAAGDQGGLYTAFVPPRNVNPNDNPLFNNFPPIFICEDAPLFYDHSATDADGDSLVYSMCAPYQELGPGNPAINPGDPIPNGFGPPFDPVVYSAPYTFDDPLGGIPLSIDSATGILTGTPIDQGTYVVGVCVAEYRNGVLLSTTIRDFQYTVTECNSPIPQIPIIEPFTGTIPGIDPNIVIGGLYEKNCEDYTITFDNNSAPPSGVPFSQLEWTWDFGDGSPISTAFEPTHTYADTGTYLVHLDVAVDNPSFPCVAPYYVVVEIFPEFEPEFITDDACQADGAIFFDQTTAPYDSVVSWTWFFGDGQQSTMQNPSHSYNNPGTYNVRLRATTEKGCLKNIIKPVTIFPQPEAGFDYTTPVCVDDVVSFVNTSTIVSGVIDTFMWDLGNNATSMNTNVVNIYDSAGTYDISLLAISDLGCRDSITQQLVVNPLPVINITTDTLICPNTSVQLNASGGITYLWSDTTNLDDGTIANPIASPGLNPETYAVLVTDANGCQESDNVMVDLHPLPPADAGEDTSVCLNVADLTVFNTSVPLTASGGVSYLWSPFIELSSNVTQTTIASPSVNRTYFVLVTDTNNCENTDSVRVTVLNPALDLISVMVDSMCFGDTVIVDVEDQGAVTSYTWTPTSFVTDPTANEPGFFPPVTTDYQLSITNYCYQDQDTVRIEVLPLPVVDAGPLDSICFGETYQFNATPTTLDYYEWTSQDPSISDPNIPNPTASPAIGFTYYLTGIDSIGTFGCISNDSVGLLVYQQPTASIEFPLDYPGFLCLGSPVTLTAETNDGIEFAWSIDPAGTFDDTTTQVTNVTPIDTSQVNVVVTNTHGCIREDSIQVDVQLPVLPSVGGDTVMCYGTFVNLQAGGGLYYSWSPASIFNNADAAFTQAFPDSSIVLEVIVSNDCFDSTISIPITVLDLPFVDAGADIFVIRDDVPGTLIGTGSGDPVWYHADQSQHGIIGTPYTFTPDVSPFVTSDYVLQIQDQVTACYNYDTATVFVEIVTLLAFPTGFSPDGNGVNDFARIIKYLNIEKLRRLSIYNRWGEEVFMTTDIEEGWDGIYKTLPQEKGVYPFVIDAVTKDNEQISHKGNITLIR